MYHSDRSHHRSSSHLAHVVAPLTIDQLTEFVSTMIYLLWHARRSSVMALHSFSIQHNDTIPCLSVNQGDAVCMLEGSSSAFRRFCQQVLTVTQLSESVVMLSLKYIAKLLQKSPHIQGAGGSEYRLFIVALLLANKFHDDHTYTNKTWSDVSGMKLHELDIMELEFLDALEFRLFVREAEFDSWRVGLLSFMAQLQNATLMNKQHEQQQLIDSTLRSIGLSLPTTPDPAWNASTNNILTQQQYLHLLNTATPPEFNEHAFATPLTRVPLRIPNLSRTQPIPIPSRSSTTNISSSSSMSLSSSLTPIDVMYHQPPPSQLYQQDYTKSVTEPFVHRTHPHPHPHEILPPTQQHPLAYPAPVRTSNRSLPRNSSNPSLASLLHNNSTSGHKQQQPLVDCYAWNKKSNHSHAP